MTWSEGTIVAALGVVGIIFSTTIPAVLKSVQEFLIWLATWCEERREKKVATADAMELERIKAEGEIESDETSAQERLINILMRRVTRLEKQNEDQAEHQADQDRRIGELEQQVRTVTKERDEAVNNARRWRAAYLTTINMYDVLAAAYYAVINRCKRLIEKLKSNNINAGTDGTDPFNPEDPPKPPKP